MTRRPRGFTLIEVVVGLSVAAIVLLVAHDVSGALADANARVSRAADDAASEAAAHVLLGSVMSAITTDSDSARLVGSRGQASLHTRCLAGGGWLEPCIARLSVESLNDRPAVVLRLRRSQEGVVIGQGANHASLTYLRKSDDGGTWRTSWTDPHALPLAIGIVLDADTAIVPVGVWP